MVLHHQHFIAGKEVEVKMAEPRKQQQQNSPLVHHVIQPVIVPSSALPPGLPPLSLSFVADSE